MQAEKERKKWTITENIGKSPNQTFAEKKGGSIGAARKKFNFGKKQNLRGRGD